MNTTNIANYTGHGWRGDNYNSSLSMKDIAKMIRTTLKKHYPKCKFSVTKDTYSLNISLMSAPFDVFATPNASVIPGKDLVWGIDDAMKNWNYTVSKGHMDVNHYYINDSYRLTDDGKKLFTFIKDLANSYNYDDSDIAIDYFSTNFYLHLAVGKWDKPFIKTN